MEAHTGSMLAAVALFAPIQSGQSGEPLHLSDLVAEQRIEVEIEGQGIQRVRLTLRSLVDESLWVRIPAGAYFVSSDPAVQNMVCVRGQDVILEARGSETATIATACANRTRAIPSREQGFSLQAAPDQEELVRLAQALDAHEIDYRERQAAVWIVTDDATDEEIATLRIKPVGDTSAGERAISQAQVVRGLQHCAAAGIDLASKAIWRDRWLLYAATLLGEEAELEGWLESRGVGFDTSAQSLADPDPHVRSTVCIALAHLRDARSVPLLIPALLDPAPAVRAEAAVALGRLGDARAVEPLCALLGDENLVVLQTTTEALGALRDPRAVLPLLGLLEPARSLYAGLAHWPLVQIGDSTAVVLLLERFDAMDYNGREMALGVFAAFADPRALDCVLAVASDESSRLREPAIRSLKAFREPAALERSVPALVRIACSPAVAAWPGEAPVSTLQRAAVQTLGILGDLRALEALLGLCTAESPDLRQDAVWALSKLADPRAREAVFRALASDEWPGVREYAAHGLATLPDPASIAPLLDAFSDEATTVCAAAAQSLIKIAGEQAIDPLIALLEDAERPEIARELAASTLRDLTSQTIYGLDPAPWRMWRAK